MPAAGTATVLTVAMLPGLVGMPVPPPAPPVEAPAGSFGTATSGERVSIDLATRRISTEPPAVGPIAAHPGHGGVLAERLPIHRIGDDDANWINGGTLTTYPYRTATKLWLKLAEGGYSACSGALVNSSRGVLFAAERGDIDAYASAARTAATALRDEINAAR